jgi:hypothetical protein
MCIVGVYDIEQIVLFPSKSTVTMCENRIELQGLSFYQAWLLDVTSLNGGKKSVGECVWLLNDCAPF